MALLSQSVKSDVDIIGFDSDANWNSKSQVKFTKTKIFYKPSKVLLYHFDSINLALT